jgi:hypothetical protein
VVMNSRCSCRRCLASSLGTRTTRSEAVSPHVPEEAARGVVRHQVGRSLPGDHGDSTPGVESLVADPASIEVREIAVDPKSVGVRLRSSLTTRVSVGRPNFAFAAAISSPSRRHSSPRIVRLRGRCPAPITKPNRHYPRPRSIALTSVGGAGRRAAASWRSVRLTALDVGRFINVCRSRRSR